MGLLHLSICGYPPKIPQWGSKQIVIIVTKKFAFISLEGIQSFIFLS